MKKTLGFLWMMSGLVVTMVGCGDDEIGGEGEGEGEGEAEAEAEAEGEGGCEPEPACTKMVDVANDINTDTTWTADTCYTLTDHIFVNNATLTIEAGTDIFGGAGTSLVITTSAQIDAVGTACDPIIFTSGAGEGNRAPMDWGGVVLLGLAPINVTGGTNSIEGFAAGTPGIEYGGNSAAHNCGTMNYVRIEFAGFDLADGDELNSLTVGGCGTDTNLDYIQTHLGSDDGVEFFGGTAGIKHALITQTDDDGLDWGFGWTGNAQFVIVQQSPVTGNAAIEADNNEDAFDNTPTSDPTIYNMTLVGSDLAPGTGLQEQFGMVLRRGTAAAIRNVIVMNFADYPIDVRDQSTVNQYDSGDLFVTNAIFFDNAGSSSWPTSDDSEGDVKGEIDEEAIFIDDEDTNDIVDPELGDALNLTAPNFVPASGSPALTSGVAPSGSFFDASATYVGAIGAIDWTAGWTAFPQD